MFSKGQTTNCGFASWSFNPCCNGMFSKVSKTLRRVGLCSFNPCCNGMFSKELKTYNYGQEKEVLILVVMECFRKLLNGLLRKDQPLRFNPCCNGMFSKVTTNDPEK